MPRRQASARTRANRPTGPREPRGPRGEPAAETRRVAVYLRRSTDEEHQPYSIDAQTTRLDAYISSQPGWVKVLTFTDNASAKDTNRPGLRAALAAARAGRIDVLLVVKVDRFSRGQRDLVALVEELTSLDVAFVSSTEAFDTSTPAGRAMLQMLGTFAEFEREMIIGRVVAGMERHVAAGKWVGGSRPDGYLLDPTTKKVVVNEERAVIVREVFDLYTRHRLGSSVIAARLNQRGLRSRTGGAWSANTLLNVLANPAYIGEVSFSDVVVTGAHPPIIDDATFAAADQLMAARGEAHSRRASNSSDYHLTGRIRCPLCGKALIGTAAHGRSATYRYYTCSTRARYGPTSCDADRLNADDLDQAVFTSLARFYRDHRGLIAAADTASRAAERSTAARERAELATLDKEITRATTATDRYLIAFEDGTLETRLLQDRLATLHAKITQLQARRDDLADRLTNAPAAPDDSDLDRLADHIDQILDRGTPAQRKALIENLVVDVKITGPGQI